VKTANNGMCNGAGACYTALSDVCQEKPTPALASCGSAGCKKACVADASSSLYNTAGEICYTDYAQHGCPTGEKCDEDGTCITCKDNGIECTVNGACCTGTCTTFYEDLDGDTYGNVSVLTKRCGTTYAGYVTNSTDCYDQPLASKPLANKAYPGSTYCGTTNRGDGSYDYNCGGGNAYCGTTRYTSGSWNTCGNSTAQAGCGVSGYLRSSASCCSGYTTSCSNDRNGGVICSTVCTSYSTLWSYGAAGTQGCN